MTCANKLLTLYGGRKEAAAALDMTVEAFRLWLKNGIPLSKAIEVERKTGGKVRADAILREHRAAPQAALRRSSSRLRT